MDGKTPKFTLRVACEVIERLIVKRPFSVRNEFNYTQEHLAESLGVAQTTYARWESGKMPFSVERVAAIAKVYGLTFDQFFGDWEFIEKKAWEAQKLKP